MCCKRNIVSCMQPTTNVRGASAMSPIARDNKQQKISQKLRTRKHSLAACKHRESQFDRAQLCPILFRSVCYIITMNSTGNSDNNSDKGLTNSLQTFDKVMLDFSVHYAII